MPLDDTKPQTPESPIALPTDQKGLLKVGLDLIERCRSSAGMRAAYCRSLYNVVETGRTDGERSLANMLYNHIDRLQSHLFSPTDLRFTLDFENDYPDEIMKRGLKVAKLLTRAWERDNTDILFGVGVFEALRYGACILKQWPQQEGEDKHPAYYSSLVMPWQFGVYREDVNELHRQPAMVESTTLSLPEVWRRIYHLPDAHKLFERIKSYAKRGPASENTSFFHQVLSTATLNVSGLQQQMNMPGGIVQLSQNPDYSIVGPQLDIDVVMMHETWAWDGKDYTTIQIIEPDILIAPLYKKSNLLIAGHDSGLHPYNLIQANRAQGYFWGRPEVVDLIRPQEWLSESAEDSRRMLGLQIDKLIAFASTDGITDEMYDQFRNAGYLNMGPGGTVNDLTPKFPQELLPMIELQMKLIDRLGGFDNLMSGRGEPGVRAGIQTNALLKTASPRLRDRSLLVERQCATAADLRLSIMEAKDGRDYWTDGSSLESIEKTKFRLSEIEEDRRVCVDSHSSSPIFADDHANLIAWGVKSGFVDGESAIEMLPFPEKEILIRRYHEKKAADAQLMKDLVAKDPQAVEKLLGAKKGHH